MIRKLIYALLILLLVSVKPKQDKFTVLISDQIKPYVVEYLNTLEANSIDYKKQNLVVMFDIGLISQDAAGIAYGMFNDSFVFIGVCPRSWQQLNHDQKKWLIWHELSHDLFNIEHTDNVEVMRPVMIDQLYLNSLDKDKIYKDLIKHIKDGR